MRSRTYDNAHHYKYKLVDIYTDIGARIPCSPNASIRYKTILQWNVFFFFFYGKQILYNVILFVQ